jgi:hypothetical protein
MGNVAEGLWTTVTMRALHDVASSTSLLKGT